jgi:uncharacterized protein (UPF0264 family)
VSLGPGALVRSLPKALGRPLADELVMVGVSHRFPTAATTFLVGLEGTDTEEGAMEVADSLHLAVAALRHDGATKVVILAYADDTSTDSTAARLAATALVVAEAAGLGVLDTVAVTNGRWRSFECDNPSCCPPEGHPIPAQEPTP